MGCCRKENKKTTNKYDIKKPTKDNKIRKKKKVLDDKDTKSGTVKTTDEIKTHKLESDIDQNQVFNDANNLQEQSIKISNISTTDQQIKSSSVLSSKSISDDIIHKTTSSDNTCRIKTLNDLQIFVQQSGKSISIIFFYANYCPYSKRMISSLRQWAQSNKDRIILYEVDVEQALELVKYYDIRAIPTIIALNKNNLFTPIWKRTANDVLSNLELSMNKIEELDKNKNHQIKEIFRTKLDKLKNDFIIFDSTIKAPEYSFQTVETSNEKQQEQYLIVLETRQSLTSQSKLILAITNDINQMELLKIIDPWHSNNDGSLESPLSTKEIPSISSRYVRNVDNGSQHSSKPLCIEETNEYHGRMISKPSINTSFTSDLSKRNDIWSESIENNPKTTHQFSTDEYQQRIYLPNSNEILYEKQYKNINELNDSSSSDRFSTLTYQHVKDKNNFVNNQQEEICVLYFGPNRCRGFEDNLCKETKSSKLSLVTLKSNSFIQ